MNTSRTTTRTRPGIAQRREELRAEMEARMQQQRQRPLPTWLATRTGRRALSLLPAATFSLGVVAALVGAGFYGALLLLATSLLGSNGLLLLRRATPMLDNTPDRLLDEREIGERNQAYRRSSQLTLILLGTLLLLAAINGLLADYTDAQLFDHVSWFALIFASLLSVSVLPAATLAWHWTADADELED